MDNRALCGRCVGAVWVQCGRGVEAQAVKCDWASVEAGARELRSLRSEWGGHSGPAANRVGDVRGLDKK